MDWWIAFSTLKVAWSLMQTASKVLVVTSSRKATGQDPEMITLCQAERKDTYNMPAIGTNFINTISTDLSEASADRVRLAERSPKPCYWPRLYLAFVEMQQTSRKKVSLNYQIPLNPTRRYQEIIPKIWSDDPEASLLWLRILAEGCE